eukprot:scaffold298208_cov33-Tisochrysis_lutea.AAC.3
MAPPPPQSLASALEGATAVGTRRTGKRLGIKPRRARIAEPLALGHAPNRIARLVDTDITAVAKEDEIVVERFFLTAHGTVVLCWRPERVARGHSVTTRGAAGTRASWRHACRGQRGACPVPFILALCGTALAASGGTGDDAANFCAIEAPGAETSFPVPLIDECNRLLPLDACARSPAAPLDAPSALALGLVRTGERRRR